MAKINSIVNTPDLKKVFNQLPTSSSGTNEDDFELRFRAVRGKRKGEKEESGGIFIGPLMLKAYTIEHAKYVSSQEFVGHVKPSQFKPNERVLLITKNNPGPLRELAKACLKQAKIPYQVVVLKPGEDEPRDVVDEDDQEGVQPGEKAGGELPVKQPTSMVISPDMDKQLALAFPPGEAAKIKKLTSKLLVGSGENFSPVLVALERVESSRSPDNLADLKSAAMSYLKHVEKNYSEKDRKDPVNQQKIKTALHVLREMEKAHKGVKPLEESVKDIWATQFDLVKKLVLQAKQVLGDTPFITRQIELLKQAGELAKSGDSVGALNLIKSMPKPLELVPAYGQALQKVEQNLAQLEKAKIPDQALNFLRDRLEKARSLGQAGQLPEAMKVLEDFSAQQKMVLERVGGLKKVGTQLEEGKEDQFDQAWKKRSLETGKRLQQLAGVRGKEDETVKEIQRTFVEAGLQAKSKDYIRANSLLESIDRMIAEATKASEMSQDDRDEQQFIALRKIVEGRLKEWALDAEGENKDSSLKNNLLKINQQFENALSNAKNGAFAKAAELLKDILKSKANQDVAVVMSELKRDLPEKKWQPVEMLYKKALESSGDKPFHEVVAELEHIKMLTQGTLETAKWESGINLSSYKIPNAKLGQGGFGTTFLLKSQDEGGTDLVMKTALNKNTEEFLNREAEVYEKVGYHPNIAKCLGMQTIDGKRGMLMESLSGGTVSGKSSKIRNLLEKDFITQKEYFGFVQHSIKSILEAVNHMHKHGFVHMDIKYDNVLYDKDGNLKIIDMGVSVNSGDTPLSQGGVVSSPEHKKNQKVDAKADVYTIGQIISVYFLNKKDFIDDAEIQKFIKWLTESDPANRPNFEEALEHEFLKNMYLSEDEVKELTRDEDAVLKTPDLNELNDSWDYNLRAIGKFKFGSSLIPQMLKLPPLVEALLEKHNLAVSNFNNEKTNAGQIAKLKESEELLENKILQLINNIESDRELNKNSAVKEKFKKLTDLQISTTRSQRICADVSDVDDLISNEVDAIVDKIKDLIEEISNGDDENEKISQELANIEKSINLIILNSDHLLKFLGDEDEDEEEIENPLDEAFEDYENIDFSIFSNTRDQFSKLLYRKAVISKLLHISHTDSNQKSSLLREFKDEIDFKGDDRLLFDYKNNLLDIEPPSILKLYEQDYFNGTTKEESHAIINFVKDTRTLVSELISVMDDHSARRAKEARSVMKLLANIESEATEYLNGLKS